MTADDDLWLRLHNWSTAEWVRRNDHAEKVRLSDDCAEALNLLHAKDREIERLNAIQRDFHNLDDVAEIRRLRQAVRLYVRSKKEGLGRNALDWWRLQEIEKESAADVSGDA